MKANFDEALTAVLKHEGGYVDHPRDKGGATNLGITRATLSNWRKKAVSKADVKSLTLFEAGAIYHSNYWNRVKGDQLPSGLDYTVFDYAVNSGPARAVIHLQQVVRVSQDGIVGPITLKAIDDFGAAIAIQDLLDKRMRFLRSLSNWNVFGKGWTNRVDGVRTLATKMVGTQHQPDDPGVITPKPEKTALMAFLEALWRVLSQLFRKR